MLPATALQSAFALMSAPDSVVALHWRMKSMKHPHSMVSTLGVTYATTVRVATIPLDTFPRA